MTMQIVRDYYNRGREAVRGVLGNDVAIYIGDIFEANKFNDGFWQGDKEYDNTFLDSHYYHVFAENPRALSPREHIGKPTKIHQRLFSESEFVFSSSAPLRLHL